MNVKTLKNRGATSVIAVLFVSLFGTISISFFCISNLNVQMAHNHRLISVSQTAAESGLAFGHFLVNNYIENMPFELATAALTDDTSTAIFNDFTDYVKTNYDEALVFNAGTADTMSFVDQNGTGLCFVLPAVKPEPGGQACFQLTFIHYDQTPQLIQLVCEGKMGNVSRTVQLDYNFKKDSLGIFDYAIFAEENISLINDAQVEVYSLSPEDDLLMQIGTNSIEDDSIVLDNSILVDGDIIVGPDGDPDLVIDISNSVEFDGETDSLSEPLDLPIVPVPPSLSSAPSLGDITNNMYLASSCYQCSSIDLENGTLTIAGDVTLYVTGDIVVGNAAKVEILDIPGASLKIYMEGNMNVINTGVLNNLTKEPRNLQVYGLAGTQEINMINSAEFYGTIYAPTADISINNSVQVYGAVIGESVLLNNSSSIYYDTTLSDLSPPGIGGDIMIVCDGNSYVEL